MLLNYSTIISLINPLYFHLTSCIENNLPCLKIAYETAVTCIPQYYNDELVIVYSKMLETGTLSASYTEYINPKILFFEELISKLNKKSTINNFHCAIAISNIESIGMVAVIKIFDMLYCLILSKKTDYIDDRIILFLNDSTKESLSCNLIKKISTFELLFDSDSFTNNHWSEMEQKKGIEENVFINAQTQVSLYNKNEEMISEHIMSLHSVTNWNIDFCSLSTVKKYNLKLSDEFFLKSVKSNLLYQLSEINFSY